MGLRKNILRSVDKFRHKKEDERAAAKAKTLEIEVQQAHQVFKLSALLLSTIVLIPYVLFLQGDWLVKPPAPQVSRSRTRAEVSAPAEQQQQQQEHVQPSAPPMQEVTAHFESECVICLEYTVLT